MPDYEATVTGAQGMPVLLLAGGAASSHGFFPGLVDALSGHRVVELDRPGTGRAVDRGAATLASGSAAAAQVLTDLGAGPAVVVGQSLGGLQAVQFATDHPDLVAGLVLLDPTPHDLPDMVPTIKRLFGVLGAPGRLPLIGPSLDLLLWKLLSLKSATAPEARSGREVMIRSASLAATARAVDSLAEEMNALTPRLRHLDAPVVLLSADRKADHDVRRSHERLIASLGGRVVAPSGAVHADHLRDPSGFNDLVRSVVAEALARATA